jgi:hypothetical protein
VKRRKDREKDGLVGEGCVTGIALRSAEETRCGKALPRTDPEILEEESVKVVSDTRTDTLTVRFRENVPVPDSDEEKPGIILDCLG